VTWVGHDWGAFAGTLAALRAPERFERLIVLCIPPPFSTGRSPRTLAVLASYQIPISTPVLGMFLARRGFAGRILRAARAKGRWTDEEIRIYDDVFRARPRTSVAMYRTFLTKELLPLARGRYARQELEVPTTIIVGDRDLITKGMRPGPWEGRPNVIVERVDGVGHFLPEEDPAAVVAAISRA
jgi:pimeloyl-ACP methyl ester carboxylesterase